MAYVKLRQNENLESAIKRFKKQVDNEGIMKTYKDKQYFQKPSTKRRLKKKESIRKYQIKQLKKDQAE